MCFLSLLHPPPLTLTHCVCVCVSVCLSLSRSLCVSLRVSLPYSWQPERQLPFSDVRLPPPADYHKDIGEGEEVEVGRTPPPCRPPTCRTHTHTHTFINRRILPFIVGDYPRAPVLPEITQRVAHLLDTSLPPERGSDSLPAVPI